MGQAPIKGISKIPKVDAIPMVSASSSVSPSLIQGFPSKAENTMSVSNAAEARTETA